MMRVATRGSALALEARRDDARTLSALRALDHEPTRLCALAERAFLGHLGASCVTPMAAHARLAAGRLLLDALVASEDGRTVLRESAEGAPERAEMLGIRVAAIGPATADALREHGVRVDVVPAEYRAEGLVSRLRPLLSPRDRILLPRAAQTRDVLVTELRELGAHVTEVAAYVTRKAEGGAPRLAEALAAGAIDAVTFTSSSTARNFAEAFSDDERHAWRGRVAVASIGPITAATAAEYGLATDIMPAEYTIPALARAIADYFARIP